MWRKSPREHEEMKKLEEALPRLKECELEKASRLHKAKTGVGCDGIHLHNSLGFDKRNEGRNRGVRRWNKVDSGRNKHARRCSSWYRKM